MPPRPRAPFQGPNPHFMHPMMNRGSYPQMYRMAPPMRPQSPQRGGGGLLAKILGGRGGQAQTTNPFSFPSRAIGSQAASRAGGGGLLKSLTDPNAINGFLTNTQKVLNSAQQIGPMVQQYGPLVRNIPSLWKLYRGFKDLPNTAEEDDSKAASNNNKAEKVEKPSRPKKVNNEASTTVTEHVRKESGQSVPKLYI